LIAGWVLLLVSLSYAALLFGVAYFGDTRPLYPQREWLRPIVYGLALAVYCSSWTFYGAVGSAAQSSLSYLPIYVGPILLFLFGIGLMERLTLVAKARKITSIADFIASRFGKSSGLAALITLIALTAAVPYIALQFKAVALSIQVLSHGTVATERASVFGDSAFYIALMLALFAILFGTRRIDATEHHHGMMLAIAVESVVKLIAFVAVGCYALTLSDTAVTELVQPLRDLSNRGLPNGFGAQTLLAFAAMFCLPRQFQVGVVECEDPRDVRRARKLFPIYLVLVSALVVPILIAGRKAAIGTALSPDAYLLWLPMAHGMPTLSVLAYVGGFSAATGMVIVEAVALATMISNELVMPALLRWGPAGMDRRGDLSGVVLAVRRIAIVVLAMLAFLYYRSMAQNRALASFGLLAFAAVVQFAPALIGALYWRGISRIGVASGLLAGFAVWIYTLLLPSLSQLDGQSQPWLVEGPFGIHWLAPTALFNITGWEPITHGAFWSLLANIGFCVGLSMRFPPSLDERLRAHAFVQPFDERVLPEPADWRGRVRVADLTAVVQRILGEKSAARAVADYAAAGGTALGPHDLADRALLQHTERVLAAAIGAASARRMLTSALRGTGLDFSEAAALLDEASQELRFNRELLSTTLENISQGISVVDAELCLVAWNRRYLELFDYPEGMVYVGCPIADLIRWNANHGECGPGDTEGHVRRRLAHMRAGTPHVFQRVRPDGSVIEMRGKPLPRGGFVTTFTDVTAYKRAEHALIDANELLEARVRLRTSELSAALDAQEQAKREAETANHSKSRFLAAASHDLLQPLNAARLFTSALRHQPHLDDESALLAERIDTAFRAAEDLLESLLEASRLEAGRYRPEIGGVVLADLFEPLRQQFTVLAQQRDLAFVVMPSSLVVKSDPHLLRRILQNFVSNALRYTRSGRVVLGVRLHGAEASLEVWDSGPGIVPEQMQRIFDEFHRIEQPSPWGEKGLGLGLSICERMARILGHPLSARSWPGEGSCFSIRVPILARRQRGSPRSAVAPPLGALGRPLHVLCLDNEPAILDGMAALLKRWNVSSDLAATAQDALLALRQRKPDLILADFHLGGAKDGLEVLGELCAASAPAPPAALITADTSAELKRRARLRGVALLHKPVKPAALRALLAALAKTEVGGKPTLGSDAAAQKRGE